MKRPPVIQIDLSSQIPVYEQIAAEFRTLLVTGELSPGAALPTVRQLARDLNVHHNTVANAYRILAGEGWLDLRRRRGVRVLPRSKSARSGRGRDNTFRSQLKRLLAGAAAEGVSTQAIARQLTFYARNIKHWALAK
ncbi:MAG: GntR family transcriptional regulator [Candidatus Acidiferrales bacterium]